MTAAVREPRVGAFRGGPGIEGRRAGKEPFASASSLEFSRPGPTVLPHAGSAGFSRGGSGIMHAGFEGAGRGGAGSFSSGVSSHASAGMSSGTHGASASGGHH